MDKTRLKELNRLDKDIAHWSEVVNRLTSSANDVEIHIGGDLVATLGSNGPIVSALKSALHNHLSSLQKEMDEA